MKPRSWEWHQAEAADGLFGTIGSAHSVSGDAPGEDRVERLRECVEEVTRKPVPRPVKRIGFV